MKKSSIIASALILIVSVLSSCNQSAKMIDAFFATQFPRYAGETYLMEFVEEDLDNLDLESVSYTIDDAITTSEEVDNLNFFLGGDAFLSSLTSYSKQRLLKERQAAWERRLSTFKEVYPEIAKLCYNEEKHAADFKSMSIEEACQYIFTRDNDALLAGEEDVRRIAYCCALNTIQKVPMIIVTSKVELENHTWQVITNNDKEFILVFSDLDTEEPKASIVSGGKTIAKDLLLNGESKAAADIISHDRADLSFENVAIQKDINTTKSNFEKNGYNFVDQDSWYSQLGEVTTYTFEGKFYRFEKVQIHADLVPDSDKEVETVYIVFDHTENSVEVKEDELVNYISKTYGDYSKEVENGDNNYISTNYTWKAKNGQVVLRSDKSPIESILVMFKF